MSKWTPERLKKDRESWEAKNNSRTTNRTASTGTAAGTANTTDKWTPERIAKARESWEAKSSGQNAASPAAAARQNTGTGLGARVLAQMTGADSGHKLQLAVPQETGRTQAYPGKSGIVTDSGTGTRSSTAQPEWLNAKSTAAPAAKVTGTVQPTERQRIAGIASGDEGWYAQTAQKVKQYTEDLKATDDFSDFDRLNQWMDADPKHRELVTLMRIGTGGQSYAEKNNAMQPQSVSGAAASAAVPEKSAGRRDYTDAELLAKGYSRKEISEARQYIADFDALPAGQRAARRAANTIGGIGDTVASSVFLAGETGVQSAKNAAATSSNWKQLQQDVQSDDRQQELLRLMTGGKTRYAARDNTLQLAQSSGAMASAPAAQTTQSDAYTDAELIEKGYTQQEMHLHNTDSLNHLMNGGLVIPDAKLYNKGDIEQAYQKGQTVHLGMLTDADGTPTADSILQTVEAAMTDYDRAWCADMKEFFDNYTTKLINETSLQLVGYQRATVKNYYPIAVDKSVLATQIDGLNLDATIEGRGFLKNRVKSGQPVLLEECANVVQRSLRDTAAYAGLAAPIRDVQKILNSGVETRERLANLKNGIIKEQWGKDAVSYIDDLLTDLQTTQRKRPSTFNKVLGNLRGNYAGAVLTLNPGVAIAQAASLPTAAAVLGGDTMAAVVPFVKNLSPKARTALETEIKEHGDVLLDWRKRGSQNGELASIGKQETLAEKGMDKLPNWLTGWINGMDEVTVAALWEGSKRYVQNHTAEFEGAEVTGSPAYWEAVNRTYQKVIEQTQPNYTVMQRAGIQRNPNELLKQLTMFTTQRFQNYGILADAIGDYRAQAERYRQNQSDENKAELQRAKTQRNRAVVSQAAQTAVFAIMKIGADFLLHRWDREQDENGDVTVKSMWKRFASLYTESFAGNFLYGSELYSLIDNAVNGKDYDVLSAASISVVNDLAGDVQKFFAEFRKDTSEMDEEQLQKHHNKLMQRSMTLLEDSFEVAGVPYGNGRKIVEAVKGYYGDLENLAHGGQFSFNSVPQSATGQYDRLYNAYAGGDSDEAKAAVEKLNAMVEAGTIAENKMYSQLKSRLVKYDVRVRQAAEEQNAGNDQKRYELENEMIEQLSEVLGLPKGKRGDVVDCVTGAVNQLAETQLKGDNASATDDLVEAVDSWDAGAVQEEYDRLAKAGKSATTLKSKITETAKPEYLAGSDADRQQMEEMLLALKDADGKELYTEKNFAQWVKEAEKKAEEGPEPDPYAAVR